MNKEILHFAHANGFPGRSYNKLLSHFSGKYKVIAIDRLGHNPKYPVNNNWTNLVDELIDFLEHTADSPVIGAGHSLGSLVTFMAAYKRPDLFNAVIMLDPPFVTGLWGLVFRFLKFTGAADRITPARQSSGRRSVWRDVKEAEAYFMSKKLFQQFDPETLSDYMKYGIESCDDGLCLAYDVSTEVKIFQTMPDNIGSYNRPLGIPGAIIYGETRHGVHIPTLKKFIAHHGFNLCTSPGGHLFPLEKPGNAAAVMKRELDRILINSSAERAAS
jgi:pimeloyl-ACP methyl ester carboxylesterase